MAYKIINRLALYLDSRWIDKNDTLNCQVIATRKINET